MTMLRNVQASIEPVRVEGELDAPNVPDEPGLQTCRVQTYAGTPWSRGTPTIYFPDGAWIYAFRWQLTAKAPRHVLLANLAVLGPAPRYEVHSLYQDLLDYRVRVRPGDVSPTPPEFEGQAQVHDPGLITLPRPFLVLPGSYVFVGVVGWGDPEGSQSVMEVQAAVWVDRGTPWGVPV
jgi:hypothetical protein